MVGWANLLPSGEPSRKPRTRLMRRPLATRPHAAVRCLSLPFSPALLFQGSQRFILILPISVTKMSSIFSHHLVPLAVPSLLGMPLSPSSW